MASGAAFSNVAAHSASCSCAAARYVSAAAMTTKLSTVASPVTVKGWDRPEIGVRVDGDYQFDAESTTPRLQSGVDTRKVELYLPAGADLDLTVDEGDAQLADIRGSASVRISDGSLRVSAHDGPLRVHAGQGSVVVDALRSEYFEIRSRTELANRF